MKQGYRILFGLILLLQGAVLNCHAAVDLILKGGLGQTYDDNITYLKENPRHDYILNLMGGLGARVETPKTTLELLGNVNHHIYYNNPDFNNTSEDASLSLASELSERDLLTVNDDFSHAYEPRSFQQEFGRVQGRYSTYENEATLTYQRRLNSQFALSGHLGHEMNKFSRDDIQDTYLGRVGTTLEYHYSSALTYSAEYNLSRRTFERGNDALLHAATGGFRKYLTPQLYVGAKAGANVIRAYDGRTFTHPVYFAEVHDDFSQTANANLSFEKRYHIYAYTQDLFNYWQLTGSLSRQLSERLGTALYGFYGSGEYVTAAVTDTLAGAGIKFNYDLTNHLKAELAYSHSNLGSTLPVKEYAKNTFFVGVSADF
ncbi:MAG: hypothetical protein A2901_05855 [Elusimicrobia bacterium RIFCSPLOWO2_01_FULL_54_10]|nr:MAG: hypothetical protein A2901_05855 [Elusimicrobia bacterium RIFCSPLOWO2_01_FULL_54_10]